MHRFLLVVDGSENSLRATDYLIKEMEAFKQRPEGHLVPSGMPVLLIK